MKNPLKYFTLKKYSLIKPVDIKYLASLLKKNDINNEEIYNKSIWLKFNKTNFFLILFNENKLLYVKRKINFIKVLFDFLLPIFLVAFKVGFENYLSNTWNTIISWTLVLFTIFWIIFRFGFSNNKDDKLFIKLLEENILKVKKISI